MCGSVVTLSHVAPILVILNNLQDWTGTAVAKKKLQPLLQNVWREVEFRIDGCRATTEACFELVLNMKEVSVYSCVRLIFVWLLRP
jgi:hypothetical protein